MNVRPRLSGVAMKSKSIVDIAAEAVTPTGAA